MMLFNQFKVIFQAFLLLPSLILLAALCEANMIEWPTTHLNANMSDAEFENIIRTKLTKPKTDFRDVREYVVSGLSLRSDTKRVQEVLLSQDDVRPKMVYATMTERPPAPGSEMHMVLELLEQRHTSLGVILGTFADDTMGEQRMRSVPTLPGRVVQVDVRHTSWGQGRNRLLQVAREAFPNFEYIAVADDDALPMLRCCRALPTVPCDTLMTEYPSILWKRKMEVPAQQLCVSDFERHLGVVRPHFAGLFAWWSNVNPLTDAVKAQATKEGGSMYQSISWSFADAIFNAFSREAIEVDNIIPYNEEVEKSSWWMSQALVNLRLLCTYGRSDSIMVTGTMAPLNLAHRDYPRGFDYGNKFYVEAMNNLKDPVKCPMKRNAGRP
jgi:hypothetical protein